MATRKRPSKRHGRAKLKIKQRVKNGGKKFSVKQSSAFLLKKSRGKRLSDPLAITLPSGYLSYDTCKHLVELKKTQYKLWSWAIVLAFVLLFAVTAIELMIDFKIISPANVQYAQTLSHATLLAVFVIGMELASGFALAKNKMLFLKNNWLAIAAIIPAGIFARAGSGVFEFFEAIASFRAFQLASKLGELSSLVPNLGFPSLQLSPIFARAEEFASSAKSIMIKIVR